MKKLIVLLCVLFMSSSAVAGVVLTGTRVVFAPGAKEASIVVRGDADANFLVQSWLEPDQSTTLLTTNKKIPLAVVPGLANVQAGKQQLLRIIYEGEGFPLDRETAVWLNVQEIPIAVKDKNVLQFATRQRIKVFFRPQTLTAVASDAVKESLWSFEVSGGKPFLKIKNPSPFYLSLGRVALGSSDDYLKLEMPMIPPFQEMLVDMSSQPIRSGTLFSFGRIGDYGNVDYFSIKLSTEPVKPVALEKKKD